MKKIQTNLLAFLLLPCCLLAQIPNADFEAWENFSPFAEGPQDWEAPYLSPEFYPVEKVEHLDMGQYAVLVKNTMPSPSSVGGSPGYLETIFTPTSQHFRLSMQVRYDSIEPPGRAKIEFRGSGGLRLTHWIDEAITGEMETIQVEAVLPEAFDQLVLRIEAKGVYDPNYGTPPFNGGYDGYAEIVVDNIVYENVVSSQESLKAEEVHIFPNPASEAAWVKTENGEFIKAINLFNQAGGFVLSVNPNKTEYLLDVNALPSGAYWMEIVLPGRRFIRQWVKG